MSEEKTPFEVDVWCAVDSAMDELFEKVERAARKRGIVKTPSPGDEDLERKVDDKVVYEALHRFAGFDVADAYQEWVRSGAE